MKMLRRSLRIPIPLWRVGAVLCDRKTVIAAAMALSACCAMPQHGDVAKNFNGAELLALLQTLNADLLSHDSATLTLERWCADHGLAQPPRIVARRVRDATKDIPDDLRERLKVGAAEALAYRHVQLACGEHVLSEADNWYVPGRLTSEMNRTLEATDEPFGKVVKPLDFRRRTVSAELLWSPLQKGWEMSSASRLNPSEAMEIPHDVLRHEAVLYTSTQLPFSAVVETYTSEIFAFGPTAPRSNR